MAVINGFRSDLSITRKTDGNFRNVSAGVLFSKVGINKNGVKRSQKYWKIITNDSDIGINVNAENTTFKEFATCLVLP